MPEIVASTAEHTPTIHRLKTWSIYFAGLKTGAKTFEVRKDDRAYKVGDYLLLQEWDPVTASYSGDTELREVTYVLRGGQSGVGVIAGHVVLGVVLPASFAENMWHVVMQNDYPAAIVYGSKQMAEERAKYMKGEWMSKHIGFQSSQWWRVYTFPLDNQTRRTRMFG